METERAREKEKKKAYHSFNQQHSPDKKKKKMLW